MGENNRNMNEREEYYFIKGARHGLMVARELKDSTKINAAIVEMSKINAAIVEMSSMLNKYRSKLNIEDDTDQLLEV
jgi:hypothetical protein